MKASNEYAQQFGRLYRKIPKSVFAAIAFSFADRLAGERTDYAGNTVIGAVVQEWRILHDNGIVPQKPGLYPERELFKER